MLLAEVLQDRNSGSSENSFFSFNQCRTDPSVLLNGNVLYLQNLQFNSLFDVTKIIFVTLRIQSL